MTTDNEQPTTATAPPKRRRFIDYPRAGRTGVRRWLPSWRLVTGSVVLAGVLAAAALALAVVVVPVPKPNDLALAQTSTFYWNDGTTVLGRAGEANRTSIPLDSVPEEAQQAVLAAEDRDFYQHVGVSPVGIARATWNNAFGDTEGVQGGSTITQQYAKNAFLTQDQTVVRKVKELVLSIKLETSVSKDTILNDYLNTVYYGRGAYGIEAASKAYFGVPASELTLEQGAMLAALLQAPNSLAPEKNLGELYARWEYVLDGMVDEGWITPAERAGAKFPAVMPYDTTAFNAGPNGHLLSAAQEQLAELGFDANEVNLTGLEITTTFDQNMQEAAVAAVDAFDPGADEVSGLRLGLASVVPQTGEVVALYGGRDYQEDQFNNATQARGQGGSTFKAFGLAAGLQDGIDLKTVYSGASPLTIGDYTLENYGNASYGDVTMLEATIDSINTPYVQMNSEIGPGRTMMAAVAAGIPADTPGLTPEINNVLGSASPTPLDEATAFATFANRGERPDTTMITEIRDTSGDVLFKFTPETTEAFSQKVADRVTYALRQVVTSGTGVAAQSADRPVAGKTGTSDNYVSAWFSGYTPQLSAAVMAVREDEQGNEISLLDEGGLTEGTGGALPAQIFGAYIDQAMADMPVEYFEEPESVSDRTASPTTAPTTAPPSQESSSPEPTNSPQPTNTPTPTVTPEPTQTPTPTVTPQPTLTPEPTLPPQPTLPPEPTSSPEPSYTEAPVTAVPSLQQGASASAFSETSPAAAVSPASVASGSTAAGAVALATVSGAGLLRRRRSSRR